MYFACPVCKKALESFLEAMAAGKPMCRLSERLRAGSGGMEFCGT
jgi:hypothetical protein